MSECNVRVYCGEGRGKTAAALGNALLAAERGEKTIIIQFMKSKNNKEDSVIKRLEPEVKVFRFEKTDKDFDSLSEEEKAEEAINIRNGLNFARKVLATEECNLLILDEILGLLDYHIISPDELLEIMKAGTDNTELILTGRVLSKEVAKHADAIYKIEPVAVC